MLRHDGRSVLRFGRPTPLPSPARLRLRPDSVSRIIFVAAGILLWLVGTPATGSAQTLQLNPPLNYQLAADGQTMLITANLANNRATATAALRLELWAFATPYSLAGPAQSGYRLATVNLAALTAGAVVNLNSQPAPYSPPASGFWNIALLALEDLGGSFAVRTSFNFATPLAVAGIMGTYVAVPPRVVGGIFLPALPVVIENLLVDPSGLYWTVTGNGGGGVGKVGLAPGSALINLTDFGRDLFLGSDMVQDNLNLYVRVPSLASPLNFGEIIRVTKTTGNQTVLARPDARLANGPRNNGLGIQLNGGTLYFSVQQEIGVNAAFVPALMARMSTQGGALTTFPPPPPINPQAEAVNFSATWYAADFTNIYFIEPFGGTTIRHQPLFGTGNTIDLSVPAGARFLAAPADGPAGASLFWLEGVAPNNAIRRRRVGGQVITVAANISSRNYALDGGRVYFESGVTGQLSSISIDGGAVTALLPREILQTTGEIVTDGNAIYWVSANVVTNVTSLKRLVLPVQGTPIITQPPINAHVAPNATNVTFTALAASGGLSYVWKRNGVALVPATTGAAPLQPDESAPPRAAGAATATINSPTLVLNNVTAADMGFYSCVITNSAGAIETDAAILTVDTGGPSRIINVSTRGLVQPGAALTPGFVMRGPGGKQLLIRAVGPTLATFGLAALADTKMDVLNQQTGGVVATNDDWGGGPSLANAFSAVGAFPLPAGSKDAAVFSNLPVNAGGYSVRITSPAASGTGIALAEVYDSDALTSPARLINVSTLGFAGTGANALTPGFVIGGTAPKLVLIRAVGPGLAPFGIDRTLADPQLKVIPLGLSLMIARSDDWGGTAELKAAFATAGAFGLPDTSKDAAVMVRLPPGGYSVVVSGANESTGTALVEVYDLDP